MKITKSLQYSEKIKGKRVTFYGNSIDEIVSDVIRIRNRNSVSAPNFNTLYNIIKPKVSGSSQVDGSQSPVFKKRVLNRNKSNNTKHSRSVTIADASRAANALMKIIPGDYVDQDEYLRRLSVCKTCEIRQKNSDCMSCGGSGKAARALLAVRAKLGLSYNMNKEEGSHFCGFCGCSLSLLLVTKTRNYRKENDETNAQRPSYCWLNRNSKNYVST